MARRKSVLKQFGMALRAIFWRLLGNRERSERQWYRLLWELLQGRSEEVTFKRDGILWTTPVGRLSVAKNCFIDGMHQAREISAVLGWLKSKGRLGPGTKAFIDVGANLGVPAIPFARMTGKRVVGIEPEPVTFALLRRNVDQNGLADQIILMNAAVSNARKETDLIVHSDPSRSEISTGHQVQGFGSAPTDSRRMRVSTLPLDEILTMSGLSAGEIALVWSDTQGHERQVIESGPSLWRAGVPLFVELWPVGLRAHGGLDEFCREITKHFKEVVLRDDLLTQGTSAVVRPIADIPEYLSKLRGHTDALLIP